MDITMPTPPRGIQGLYWNDDKRGPGKWSLGCGPSSGYIFCMCSAGCAGEGDREGEEEGVFAMVKGVAEAEWELWRGNRERRESGRGGRHEILLSGSWGEVDVKEGRNGGARRH